MTNTLQHFIETNMHIIREKDFFELYSEAYERLPEYDIDDLNDVVYKLYKVDGADIAKSVLKQKIKESLIDVKKQYRTDTLSAALFVSYGLSHLLNIDFDEYQQILIDVAKTVKGVTAEEDGFGNVYISWEK